MDNARGGWWGGWAEIWVYFFHTLAEILYGQPHVFKAMNSWKRLSLSMTPGARMQMISAPNIDRLDFLPLPNKGAVSEGGCMKDAVATGQGRLRKRHSDRRSIVWDITHVPQLRPGRNNAMMPCECQKCQFKKTVWSTATRCSLLRQLGGGLVGDLP